VQLKNYDDEEEEEEEDSLYFKLSSKTFLYVFLYQKVVVYFLITLLGLGCWFTRI
jgi:hypothetical protein